jgi:hypothetical protein
VGKSDTRPALAHGHAPVAVVARAVKMDQKSLIAAKMDGAWWRFDYLALGFSLVLVFLFFCL